MVEIWGTGYTFDDVFLVPARSAITPSQVDLSVRWGKRIRLGVPVLSAAMDTLSEAQLAIALARQGGLGVIHRNLEIEAQADEVAAVKGAPVDRQTYPHAATDEGGRLLVGAAIGVGEEGLRRAEALVQAGVDVLVIDTAHGHSQRVVQITARVKERLPQVYLIAGNVATAEGTLELIQAGADAVKVGVGPGSVCTTREVAGVGVPQITALMECAKAARSRGVPLIADGGMKSSGDVVKALAAGAAAVMLGSLLAGVEEAPGEAIQRDGRRYKRYRGMGSQEAMAARVRDRYAQEDALEGKIAAEGISALVPYQGLLSDHLQQLMSGVRSGVGYVGAANIAQLQERARFVIVTPAGRRESRPEGLIAAE